MISIREQVVQTLTYVTHLDVYFVHPPVEVDVTIPLLVLNEVENSDHFYRMNGLEITNIGYEVSLYCSNPMHIIEYLPLIDEAMKQELGLIKTYTSSDMYVEPLYCKTIRFTGKAIYIDDQLYIGK